MKKGFLFLPIFLLWVSLAFAQLADTPNIGLNRPDFVPGTWGELVDENWRIIDSKFPGGVAVPGVPRVTFANLPTANLVANQLVVLIDAPTGTTCGSGGGTTENLCQWTGTIWTVVSAGGGTGGGGSFSGVTSGTNLGQTLTVGNGSALNTSGTGTIAATTSATATALAANGTNCPARQSPLGVDAAGNAEGCFDAGHVVQDEGTPLTQRPTMNFTGAGVTVTDAGGLTVVNVPGGAGTTFTTVGTGVNTSSIMTCGTGCQILTSGTGTITPQYTPAGTIAATTVQGAITELESETTTALAGKQPLDADLTALAANTTAGFWAAATNVARSMATASANNIGITNPAGVAGNPTFDVGPNVALTTRSFTAATGDWDLSAALSLTVPRATGASPTASGRIAYDNTTNRLRYGSNGTTFTIADTATTQALNANLTALSGLSGVNGKIPYFTGAGTMALTSGLETPCADVAGQHLNLSSIGTFVCGTSSTGGVTGQTTGTIVKALSPTSLGPSIITESAGVINIAGGVTIGNIATDSIDWDTTAYAGHGHVVLTIPYVGGPAKYGLTTGTLTTGNIVKVGTNGDLIDGGAAGTGTWTDSSTNTGTNKTLVATGAGGTNTITTPIVASFDGGAITPDGTNCTDPTKTTVNSGPTQYAFVCPTPASAVFDAALIGIKNAVTTIRVRLKANDTASTQTLAGTFKAQCRASGTSPSSTWGTTQTVSITLTTANTSYEGLTAAITPNGTCSLGADLYIRFNATAANSATTRILGLVIEQLS